MVTSGSGGPDPSTTAAAHDGALARFGWLLGLIGASIVFTMAAPEAAWGQVVAIVLHGGVLLLAVRAVDAPPRLRRIATGAAVGALAVGAGSLLLDPRGSTRLSTAIVAALGIVLVAAAIAAIVDHLRAAGRLTGRTVLGAICVYLLIGGLFTFTYVLLGATTPEQFFAGGQEGTLSSLQYFSFTTLTTVGFGDLVPATSPGRATAMLEALLGQIYLVTVVALVVGNLVLPGRAAGDDGPTAPGGPDDRQS